MRALLALAFAGLLAAPALALPTQVEAEYHISAGGIAIGRVHETYVRKGDAYRIESTTRAEGVFKLFRDDTVIFTSEGRVGPRGLEPLRFEQRRSGDASRDLSATFDWEKSQLRSS